MSGAVAVKVAPRRPVFSETLLEIPRTTKSRLVVELCRWDEAKPASVRLLVLALGVNGVWFVTTRRATLRLSECAAVARVLAEVAE